MCPKWAQWQVNVWEGFLMGGALRISLRKTNCNNLARKETCAISNPRPEFPENMGKSLYVYWTPGSSLSLPLVGGYFDLPNKSTHTKNAISAAPDTMTRNAKVPIVMPIQ